MMHSGQADEVLRAVHEYAFQNAVLSIHLGDRLRAPCNGNTSMRQEGGGGSESEPWGSS